MSVAEKIASTRPIPEVRLHHASDASDAFGGYTAFLFLYLLNKDRDGKGVPTDEVREAMAPYSKTGKPPGISYPLASFHERSNGSGVNIEMIDDPEDKRQRGANTPRIKLHIPEEHAHYYDQYRGWNPNGGEEAPQPREFRYHREVMRFLEKDLGRYTRQLKFPLTPGSISGVVTAVLRVDPTTAHRLVDFGLHADVFQPDALTISPTRGIRVPAFDTVSYEAMVVLCREIRRNMATKLGIEDNRMPLFDFEKNRRVFESLDMRYVVAQTRRMLKAQNLPLHAAKLHDPKPETVGKRFPPTPQEITNALASLVPEPPELPQPVDPESMLRNFMERFNNGTVRQLTQYTSVHIEKLQKKLDALAHAQPDSPVSNAAVGSRPLLDAIIAVHMFIHSEREHQPVAYNPDNPTYAGVSEACREVAKALKDFSGATTGVKSRGGVGISIGIAVNDIQGKLLPENV